MSESMVEKVSEALRKAMSGNDCLQLVCRHPPCECADDLARAAIDAMREPTEEMVWAGFEHTGDPCWQDDVKKAYRAMIDTALNPKA